MAMVRSSVLQPKSLLKNKNKSFQHLTFLHDIMNNKTDIFPRELGRKLARLQQKREKSDYDDFYIASREEAEEQISYTVEVVTLITEYLKKYL